MGRILGLDYGTKTVGVALSDPLLLTAQEFETITRERASALRHTLVRIKEICEEYDVELIVLGYPRNMDDTEGFRCEDTLKFKGLLEKRVDIPIVLVDERLTTVYADEILEESGVAKKDRKKVIDQIAAAIILQDYLDNK
ncbi:MULTISPECIES: Holliday junction resolvase RuvX [Pseudobutyrivibrio]|jgi:putative Holliday junction resolvase|uniref:Putative pre-16S rRNA nuclease n=1 Tax=Pseudobutyrivibrio xylanivorans TaxID=185007 RepID=A0A6M0LF83_PSEXY|nr:MULTISPECIES: Holliday junction resolvase RuvX [Pseudobutyrivibrio]MBE5904348.1 Holliday junction resolvase RuvX [Pseudobutyrivibrio sp.]NEX01272.1 Holliday junction resolvase RuvX [Pseudobutyrivibrio xylanivorans]SCX75842.1 putative holliday junction resolvase [Pseudobutyrivibrio sp. AR14]SFR66073.1 putative holliday junction resolvase [Pseudobutyrivibrio sp. NOR37]